MGSLPLLTGIKPGFEPQDHMRGPMENGSFGARVSPSHTKNFLPDWGKKKKGGLD